MIRKYYFGKQKTNKKLKIRKDGIPYDKQKK